MSSFIKVNIIAIPSFVENCVLPGLVASFDSLRDKIKLFFKIDDDDDDDNNVFQRFMQHTNLPNLLDNVVSNNNTNYEFQSVEERNKHIQVLEKDLTEYLEVTNLSKLPDYDLQGHEFFSIRRKSRHYRRWWTTTTTGHCRQN